ncbi:hypothetical protein FDI40_gp615 [Agrobacterium phage Atu_ph07]|uniref:Uncharacterized protein n=1 Tax=Agrobacterium phage Atu_ph07 TaxID=2024264 RepID=A0A2L0V0P9_9CAUD|nr:hypothetical protein FDI40_gp615 [Agrobacterium phage Atu_ph07]AUZ95374.1 hypothetical protein [Agrobacterium phage Atu_ph07]
MKSIIAISIVLISTPAYAFSAKVENFLGQYAAYNSICRGTVGDDNPVVELACESRDVVAKRLDQEGICYGKIDQEMYEMKWHKCEKDSNRY